jgi:hypothetical protein
MYWDRYARGLRMLTGAWALLLAGACGGGGGDKGPTGPGGGNGIVGAYDLINFGGTGQPAD